MVISGQFSSSQKSRHMSNVCAKNVTEKMPGKFESMFHDGTPGKWSRLMIDREAVEDQDDTPKQEDIMIVKDTHSTCVSSNVEESATGRGQVPQWMGIWNCSCRMFQEQNAVWAWKWNGRQFCDQAQD